MASAGYHEPVESLSPGVRDRHRAIVSLMEELEAIDWYMQRAEATGDTALRAVLIHNRNEEIEHAMMLLEWLRRNDEAFDPRMRTYLFRAGDIVAVEAAAMAASRAAPPAAASPVTRSGCLARGAVSGVSGSLGIGSLKSGASEKG